MYNENRKDLKMRDLPQEVIRALMQKRQILFVGDVDNEAQEKISASILYLNSLSDEPITLFIDSMGGKTNAGLWMADAVSVSQAPVCGVVIGVAYSMAFNLLQACQIRKAYPHAELLVHGICARELVVVDDEEKFEREVNWARRHHEEMMLYYSRRSGQPLEMWKDWSKKEKKFSAREALELVIIDEIIQPVPLQVPEK